ncbi:hypothetical protein [Solobacterium moorei]
MDYYNWNAKWAGSSITELKDYTEGDTLKLYCYGVSEEKYPLKKDRDNILKSWIDYFNNTKTNIKRLLVKGIVNQKLLEAICNQTSLEELVILQGNFSDIHCITKLKNLKALSIYASSRIKSLGPISELRNLKVLILSNFTGVTDYSPLAKLKNLKQLGIHSSMGNVIKVDSLDFLQNLKNIKNFHTTGFRLLNRDYSPVLELEKLEFLSVNMPAYDYKIWNDRFAEKFRDIPQNMHIR